MASLCVVLARNCPKVHKEFGLFTLLSISSVTGQFVKHMLKNQSKGKSIGLKCGLHEVLDFIDTERPVSRFHE